MVFALCMAYNLSVFHQLITPTAILCIIPPLSTDFVIITDMGSSYEIGSPHPCFFKNSTDSQHTLRCIQSTAFRNSQYFPWPPPTHLIDASLRRCSQSIALDFMPSYHYTSSYLSPAFLFLSSLLLVWVKSRYGSAEV